MAGADNGRSSMLGFSEAEKQLIRMIRELKYGEIRVIIQDGKPVRAEDIKKSVVLGQSGK